MQNARKTALDILCAIEKDGAFINIELKKVLNTNDLPDVDKRFVTELVHGVVKYKIRLDYIIGKFSSVKLKKISPYILNVLRLGIYQLCFLDKIPQSAAINESVKLAKRYNFKSAGFVNAILRNVTRSEISYPSEKSEYLSVYYSFEKWMTDKFLNDYGVSFAEKLMESLNERRNLTIHCNTLKTDAKSLIEELSGEGITCKKHGFNENIIEVSSLGNVLSLKSFKDGNFYVQDAASSLCAYALSPKEGDFVIDVCAAPGGKTSVLAQIMKNKGKILAFDIYEHKLSLMQENFKRLGITIAKTLLHNSEETLEEYRDKADCVLVDAPCSGLGIISRKPDIKYSLKNDDIKTIAEKSYKILCASSEYVKKGGTLVYSLCTFTPEEGEENIKKFLNFNKEFELDKITCYNKQNDGMITVFPNECNADGFFICRMKRK